MTLMILGLVLFLAVHSVRIFADGWRTATIARLGAGPWKGLYSLASLAGFVMLCWGFGVARENPLQLWQPPVGMRHLAAPLTLLAFIGFVAAYVPNNKIKGRLHHPMLLGVKSWALAHLLANGNLAHVVLFGGFLAWAVVDFIVARRRDRAQGVAYPPGVWGATAITVVVGAAAWYAFAFWLHGLLIGVRPLG